MKRIPHSFTLLELMVVLVMLGLLAGYALRGALDYDRTAIQTLRRIASIDADARLLARRHGGVALQFDTRSQSEKSQIRLIADEIDRSYIFEAAIEIRGLAPSEEQVLINPLGQSLDYQVMIANEPHVLSIAGLTGWSWIDHD